MGRVFALGWSVESVVVPRETETNALGIEHGWCTQDGRRPDVEKQIAGWLALLEQRANGRLGPPASFYQGQLQPIESALLACTAAPGAATHGAGSPSAVAGAVTMPLLTAGIGSVAGWPAMTVALGAALVGAAVFVRYAFSADGRAMLRRLWLERQKRHLERQVRAADFRHAQAKQWVEARLAVLLPTYDLAYARAAYARGIENGTRTDN